MEKPTEPDPPTPSASALEELQTLPSFEDTKAQVQSAVDEITSRARTIVPAITFQTPHEGSSETCHREPYEQTGAQGYFLPDAIAVRPTVSESDWTKILAAAKESAHKIGATDMQVMQDQPGNHDVWFSGPGGIFIKIGYRGNLVVSGYTGCRLPRDKK